MNGLFAWGGAVCMAAAGCTLVHLFVGKDGIGKTVRLITAAFFLCAVLSPLPTLKNLSLEIGQEHVSTDDTANLQSTAVLQLQTATEEILLDTVNTALKNHRLSAQKVSLNMDTLENGSISINSIVIYTNDESGLHRGWIREIAEKRLGTAVDVRYIDV